MGKPHPNGLTQTDQHVRADSFMAQIYIRNVSPRTLHGQRSHPRPYPSSLPASDYVCFVFRTLVLVVGVASVFCTKLMALPQLSTRLCWCKRSSGISAKHCKRRSVPAFLRGAGRLRSSHSPAYGQRHRHNQYHGKRLLFLKTKNNHGVGSSRAYKKIKTCNCP
jgi:hypothetical protein